MPIAENLRRDGFKDRIEAPFLVAHGQKDSQIPRHWAERACEQPANGPRRGRKAFTERESGIQHTNFDNSNAGAFIADWVAEAPSGRTAI